MTAAELRLAETLIRLGDATELAERLGMSADFVRRIQAELNAKTELDAEREINVGGRRAIVAPPAHRVRGPVALRAPSPRR
jgi:hypothetical protein